MKLIIISCVLTLLLTACSVFDKAIFAGTTRPFQILPGLAISAQRSDDFTLQEVPGGDPAIIIDVDDNSYLVTSINSQKAFLDLPAKINISDGLFLRNLFDISNEDYTQYRPSFFIDDDTLLLRLRMLDCGEAYIVNNEEEEKTKAYILFNDRLAYSIHPLNEMFTVRSIVEALQLNECRNNKLF